MSGQPHDPWITPEPQTGLDRDATATRQIVKEIQRSSPRLSRSPAVDISGILQCSILL
jgi:hypothetical protein